jgi:hypothetical protein
METVAELAKFKLVFMAYRKSDGIIFVPIQQLITMKLQFYYPGFYFLCEFTHFIHRPGQVPIMVMSVFNRFYVSST